MSFYGSKLSLNIPLQGIEKVEIRMTATTSVDVMVCLDVKKTVAYILFCAKSSHLSSRVHVTESG
jgi:hypothetical protein